MKNPSEIQKKIKFIRQVYHLTQKQLAEAIGVSVRTVEGWEIGKTEPSEPSLKLMNITFPVNMDSVIKA